MNETEKAALFQQMRAEAANVECVVDLLQNNCGALTQILIGSVPTAINEKTAHKLAHVMIDAIATFGEGLKQCADDAEAGDEHAMQCIIVAAANKTEARH